MLIENLNQIKLSPNAAVGQTPSSVSEAVSQGLKHAAHLEHHEQVAHQGAAAAVGGGGGARHKEIAAQKSQLVANLKAEAAKAAKEKP